MLVLFDHGTPKGLIRALPGHTVHTAQAKGWDTLSNGALLKVAEQNLSARRIAMVVLTGSTKWSRVRKHTERIAATVAAATPGSYAEVDIPFDCIRVVTSRSLTPVSNV